MALINKILIILILKIKNTLIFTQFKLISLCNQILNIIWFFKNFRKYIIITYRYINNNNNNLIQISKSTN